MKRARPLPGAIAAAGLFAAGLAGSGCDSSQPLDLEAAFDTAGRLDVGDEVRIADETVGTVTGLDWTEGSTDPHIVRFRVLPEYRRRVTEDSTVRLEMESYQNPDFYVRVIPGARGAARPGHRFTGEVSLTARLASAVRRTVDEVLAPEVRNVVEEARQELSDTIRRSREEWERARPEMERRLAELTLLAQSEKERLTEEGRAEIDRLLSQYEAFLDENSR